MRSMGRSAATVAIALGACLFVIPAPSEGQEGRKEVEEGNRLYAEGRYPEAHARYLEALRLAPGSPLIRFNEGNALYQSEEFERALEAFSDVVESGSDELGAGAWYNLGNALVRQGQLPEAAEAYKETLRRDPTDLDAKHNLELVLQQMQENQQTQSQEDQSQDDESQDQEDQGGSDGGDQQDRDDSPDSGDQGGGGPEGGQPDEPNDGQEPQQGDGEGREQPLPPGLMSREEAERLLQALQEDPGEVDRQAGQARGRRPRKDW